MKLFKSIALAAVLSLGLSACLKDKTAEEAPVEQTQDGQPAPDAAPADAGETQSAQ